MALTRTSLRQFEAFCSVADLHSFGAAGARLGLTASAISQLVAELELTLGFKLFDRTTRRVILSSAGGDFLPSAQSVLRHADAAESVANDVRQRASGVVRIGAPLVLAATALPAAIKIYLQNRPKVIIRIHDVAVDDLMDSLQNGDIDLAVGPNKDAGNFVRGDVAFESPWVLWCAPDHPLARLKKIKWERLRHESIVAVGRDHESNVASMLTNTPTGERVTPAHIVDNITTALGIASQGLSTSLAPAYVGAIAGQFDLVMRRVVAPETIRQICIYQSTARTISPAAEGFAEFLKTSLKTWHQSVCEKW